MFWLILKAQIIICSSEEIIELLLFPNLSPFPQLVSLILEGDPNVRFVFFYIILSIMLICLPFIPCVSQAYTWGYWLKFFSRLKCLLLLLIDFRVIFLVYPLVMIYDHFISSAAVREADKKATKLSLLTIFLFSSLYFRAFYTKFHIVITCCAYVFLTGIISCPPPWKSVVQYPWYPCWLT